MLATAQYHLNPVLECVLLRRGPLRSHHCHCSSDSLATGRQRAPPDCETGADVWAMRIVSRTPFFGWYGAMLFMARACKADRVPSCLEYPLSSSGPRNAWRFASMARGRLESGRTWFRVTQSCSDRFELVGSWRAPLLQTYICFCKQNHEKFKTAFNTIASYTTSSRIIILFLFCSYFSHLLRLLRRRLFILYTAFFFSFFSCPPPWLLSPIPVLASSAVHLIKIVA